MTLPNYIQDETTEWREKNRKQREAEERRDRYHTADLKYAQVAAKPERLVDVYAQDLEFNGRPMVNLATGQWSSGTLWNTAMAKNEGRVFQAELSADDRRLEAMTGKYEEAYLKHRGNIPVAWWLSQDPQDLELLNAEDMPEGVAESLYYAQEFLRWQEERDTMIEEMTAERYEQEMASRGLLPTALRIATAPLGLAGAIIQGDQALLDEVDEITGHRFTETPEQARERILEEVRAQVYDGITPPAAQMGLMGDLFMKGVGAIGWVIERGVSLADPLTQGTAQIVDFLGGENFYDIRVQEFEAEQAGRRFQMDLAHKKGEAQRMQEYKFMATEDAFEIMEAEEPEAAKVYIDMAGGDRVMAMGFFGADIEDELEVSEQLATLREQDDRDYQAYVQGLEEADYRVSATVLDWMAAYGTHVPMRLATAATLLVSDDDLLQDTVLNGWENLWSEVEKHEYSPANVLGIDGTAVGFALDMGAGIAFDPTTWFFGPRAGAYASRASTGAQVAKMAKSGLVTRTIKDMARIVRSSAHGNMELTYLAGWLDEVGMLGPAMEKLGVRAVKRHGGRRWVRADKRAAYAQEIEVSAVRRLLDDVEAERLDNIDGGLVDNLNRSIEKDGYHGVIELEYSLEDGTFHLADGGKRLRAAEAAGDAKIPVTVRVKTSRRAEAMPKIKGLEDTDVMHIADLAVGRVKATMAPARDTLGQTFKNFEDAVPRQRLGDGGYDVIGKVETKAGEMEVRVIDYSDSSAYYLVDKDGTVRAGAAKYGLDPNSQISLDVWTDTGMQGQGLQNHLFDAARQRGDELLVASGRSGELTTAGQINAQAQARRFFKERGIDPDTLPGPRGVKLKDVLEEGEKVPSHSKRASAYEPTVGDQVYVRPDKLLPDRMIYGDIDIEGVRDVIRVALERGATLPSATRLATAAGWNTAIRTGLRKYGNSAGKWVERYLSPQNKVTRLELHGPTAVARINETAVRLWGEDTAHLDYWLGRVMDVVEEETKRQAKYADDISTLTVIRKQQEVLDDMLGGGWDDGTRHLDADLQGPLAKTDLNTGEVTLDEAAIAADFDNDMAYLRGTEGGDSANKAQILQDLGTSPEGVRQLVGDAEGYKTFIREHERWHQENPGMFGYDAELAATDRALQAARNRRQARLQRDALEQEYYSEMARLDAALKQETAAAPDLQGVIDEMWDDFNRQHIATNPEWAGRVDPETGLVPWEELRRGRPRGAEAGAHEGKRRMLSDEQIAAAREAGIKDPEALAQQLSAFGDIKTGVEIPLSPLDMVIASERGGAAYAKITQNVVGHGIRESLQDFNLWWIMDKVFSPATALTVSIDELQRIFHYGGSKAVLRWGEDKALLGSARAAALLRQGKWNPRHGMRHLPKRAQERIRKLQDYPALYKQAERQSFDGMGLGWTDIAPGDTGYLDAARRWMGGYMQDSGFRAFLRGEDAFREWFLGPDGHRLRNAAVIEHGSSRMIQGADEAYQGWQTMLDHVILNEAGPAKGDVLTELRNVAEQIDNAGGGRVIEPPDWVYNHLGTVRGVQKQAPHKVGITKATDLFFDNLFMKPVNYRRGVIADMVRTNETRRLQNLFESTGKRVIPDTELERVLGMQGLGGASYGPLRRSLHQQAFDRGYVTQGYIDDLVEHRVVSEVDNILFTWDQGSRLGNQSKLVFPFGRPWADMMGFWGREVLARPAVRGWLGNRPGIGTVANNLADRMLFNPKPVASVSRIAALDFEIDSLAPGVDLPFGAEEADFSPMLFMPTGGDNPFASLLPGLGIVPLWAIDQLVNNIYDPLENPVEYQELVDSIGDFIPSVAYQRGGNVARLLGGGITGASLEVMADVFGATGSRPFFNLTSELGDIGREINRARELSILMADPEEFEALLALEDREAILLAIEGMATEADQRASVSHGAETVGRKLLPVGWQHDDTADQLQQVWIDAGAQFTSDLGLPADFTPADPKDDDAMRQQADDVRTAFFKLEQWERDLLVAQNPAIAVNLISSWDYTALGIATLGVEAGTAYRTDGSREARTRHQMYVDKGLIRPIEPVTRALRILGLQQAAKENAAKETYTTAASQVNDAIWEVAVTEDTKAFLESIAQSEFGQARGFKTGREVWHAWGALEAELEDTVARENGVTEEMEQWDQIKDLVKIATDEKPWGQTWPGLATGTSQRFQDIVFSEPDEKLTRLALGLGMEIQPGISGSDLFLEVSKVLTDTDALVYNVAREHYDDYIGTRTVGKAAWETILRNQASNPNLHEDWRRQLQAFVQKANRVEQQMFDLPDGTNLPVSEAQALVDEFQKLRMTAPKNMKIDWEGAWAGRYERSFGALDWTPPVPPTPFDEDGNHNPNAYTPYIQAIKDGDTLVVSEHAGPRFFWMDLEGTPKMKEVRLLGVMARELSADGGIADRSRLVDFLTDARDSGEQIWLIRDPSTFGTNTDVYGRELAWLVVGDNPYYFPETLDRSITEGGNE